MPFHARHVSPPAGVEGFRFNENRLIKAPAKSILPRGVIRLSRLGLNHNGGIPTLVILRFVGDRSDHIAGRQSEATGQCSQCRNSDGHNDFDDFLVHSGMGFFVYCPAWEAVSFILSYLGLSYISSRGHVLGDGYPKTRRHGAGTPKGIYVTRLDLPNASAKVI